MDIQALRTAAFQQRLTEAVAEYEDKIANLRIEITVQAETIKEQQQQLSEALDRVAALEKSENAENAPKPKK